MRGKNKKDNKKKKKKSEKRIKKKSQKKETEKNQNRFGKGKAAEAYRTICLPLFCLETKRDTLLVMVVVDFFQCEDKFGSYAFGADNVNIFVVGMDDLFYNGKSESGSFFVLAAGEI